MRDREMTRPHPSGGFRRWLAAHVPAGALKLFWMVSLVVMIGGIISAWVQVAIEPNAARAVFALFWTVLLGFPAVDEWRHRDEILG